MPSEYYNMLPHEFHSTAEGYAKRCYKQSSERRYQSFISILPYTKDMTLHRFCTEMWPLQLDDFGEYESRYYDPVPDPEIWAALKKQLSPKKTEYDKIIERNKALNNG